MLFVSCNGKQGSGEIFINNLKKDTTISISTDVSHPSKLKLQIENLSKTFFMVDENKIDSNQTKKEIVEDRYTQNFSIRIKVHPNGDTSVHKSGINIKIAYSLL